MHIFEKTSPAKNFQFLAFALLFYVCMILFYINIGEDMTPINYVGYLVPVVFALFLAQYATETSFFSLYDLPHAFVGLSWCITFPLLYSWSYNTTWFIEKIRIDFLFGIGLFILLTTLEALCSLPHSRPKIIAGFFSFFDFLCLLIPLTECSYYAIYNHCLTPATLMALYLSNRRESLDFLEANISLLGMILILIGIGLFFFFAYLLNYRFVLKMQSRSFDLKKKQILFFLTICMLIYIPFSLFPETSIITNWGDVNEYVHETQEYGTHYTERFNNLELSTASTLAQKAPGTVIMIIGESATRNYMKAYTPSIPYDNTPWLEERMHDPNFVVFRNVYSCWVQTVPVLQRALTEESQYNDKIFSESTSLLDIAKKAGYETYWFSNQGRYGQFDSAITLVAKTADHANWTDDSYVFTDKFDGDLLQFLPTVDPSKNNFIVLHLMGSHIYYNNRYPDDYEKWKEGDRPSTEEAYANSTLYTDAVLSQIYQYAKDNLNLQAMVYYSDHGEDIHISHNPDVFKFDMVRIPMFVYLSNDYKAAYPLQSKTLQQNENQFFTNDMIYDTVCGILNAPSNHYDAGQDFSSPQYRFNQETLTTMLGEKKLTEDPYLSGLSN